MSSKVEHPTHYNQGKIEVIDFVEDQGLNFPLGNVVKYTCRAQHKGAELEDLNKALWYLLDGTHPILMIRTNERNVTLRVVQHISDRMNDWAIDLGLR